MKELSGMGAPIRFFYCPARIFVPSDITQERSKLYTQRRAWVVDASVSFMDVRSMTKNEDDDGDNGSLVPATTWDGGLDLEIRRSPRLVRLVSTIAAAGRSTKIVGHPPQRRSWGFCTVSPLSVLDLRYYGASEEI